MGVNGVFIFEINIDLIFNGTIGADGEPTAGNEHIISDLKTHYAPN